MSTECQACTALAELFLCRECVVELRTLLTELPWWINRLAEAAIGQVKLGDGGRGSSRREPFKGDDEALAKCACTHAEHEGQECGAVDREVVMVAVEIPSDDPDEPNEVEQLVERPCRCVEYQSVASQSKLRAQFLAAGRVNARASKRMELVRNSLITWVRHLCEQRGVPMRNVRAVPPSFIGPLPIGTIRCRTTAEPAWLTLWLAEHVLAIANDEAAGECLADLKGQRSAIEKLINRPIPQKYLGPCPTWNEQQRQACGRELWAPADAVEVYCPQCRQAHNPDRLQLLMMNDLERKKITWDKLVEVNRMQPQEFRIADRTLGWWRSSGKLKVRGYRRPDGREVITHHSDGDVPLYLWSDVRKLRAEKPQKAATGAAAHKKATV